MSLTAPLQNDSDRTGKLTMASGDSPPRAVDSGTRRFNRPSVLGLSHRVFAWQLGSGLIAIAILLAAVAIVTSGQAGSQGGLFNGTPWQPSLAWLPVIAALGVSIGLIFLGAAFTRRSLRPVAEMEGQLYRVAMSTLVSSEDIASIEGVSPFETGWNRLVESVCSADREQSLDDRLETAMLEYRHQRGEQILNVLTDGIAVTDDNQQITFANNALCSILNVDGAAKTLLNESIEVALARTAGKPLVDEMLDPRYRGRRMVAEIKCPGGDSACILRVCRSPLGERGGATPGGFVWSIRDITQQKMADKMRDQFVNAATHELRTPMANIKAYAETLALGEVDDIEQQKSFCNVINDEVTRLARFVDDLLHLSRMEVGATTLQLQVTDMKRFFEETVEKIRPQMIQKDIQFTVELPAKLPELTVDKDKLTVAVINLLGNGAKYTPNGGSVRMHVGMAEDKMQIDVEDTGIGIAEDELPRVLEKFYRSSDPRVHGETGSGLGLSLTHEIIRLHGGKLSISSELDKGSKFTFTLPTTTG